jgi:glycosyltransferase involved in cell wall biosynthesis
VVAFPARHIEHGNPGKGYEMKIAYICADFGVPVFGFKGASVHIREVISAWQRAGHEVIFFSPVVKEGDLYNPDKISVVEVRPESSFDSIPKDFRTLDKLLGLEPRHRFDLRRFLYNVTLFHKVKPILTNERFDFIYERYSLLNYAGIALARKVGVPHILEVNAPLCYEHGKTHGVEVNPIANELERSVFMESDRMVVVSKKLVELAEGLGVPSERILLIPNGVNPSRFKPDEVGRHRIRTQLQIQEKIVIGFVGSLKPWHGVETLAEAFCRIYYENADVHLLIVGDGPKRTELESQLQRYGLATQVTWTGNVSHADVPAYISAMDIAVAPYVSHDNFYYSPVKIFEYMAVEKPVVAGGIGQVNETIIHRDTGLLYEPGNVIQLRNTLQELIDSPDLRERLGKAAREWVIRNRTWDGNAKIILNTAEKILYDSKHRGL